MGGPNKILTVSYGTFSCTLEGFDDPFSTMKAIAEYFRDLASEDRFFGAEPPTPDVQMLHAIAQKSSEKPVDAQVAENGLRLTQGHEAAASPQDAEAPMASAQPELTTEASASETPFAEMPVEAAPLAEIEEAPEDVVETVDVEEEPTAAEAPEIEATEVEEIVESEPVEEIVDIAEASWSFEDAESDAESIEVFAEDAAAEEELQAEITAPDAEDVSEDVTATIELEASDEPEEIVADPPSFADAIVREVHSEAEFAEDTAEDAEYEDADVAALFQIEETQPEDAATEEAPDQPEASEEAPAASSITARLQRIRSVVAASVAGFGSGSKDADSDDMVETDDLTDEAAYALDTQSENDMLDDAPTFVPTAEVAEEAEDPATEAVVAEADKEESDFAEEMFFEDEAADFEQSFEDELAAIEDDKEIAPRRGVALELSDEDLIAAAAMARPRNAPRPQAFERTIEAEQEQSVADQDTGRLEDGPEAVEEDSDVSALQDELRNDLAAIEDDIARLSEAEAQAEAEAAAEEAKAAAEEAAEARRARAQESLGDEATGENDETVERLLSQTNSKLNDDHTQRRQSALAHLKAAVAATIADRVSPKDSEADEESDAAVDDYRKDLASIVRPKVVEETADQDEEDDVASAAHTAEIEPLVLVPQARVETGAPVRPRRISRDQKSDELKEQSTGFADYADEMGAKELHELLEAAAAYLSTVEGKTHFSRPEVMHMVMRHDRDRTFSREAQLRSFGDLLRNGTIEKVDRGQFVISNGSRFVANG